MFLSTPKSSTFSILRSVGYQASIQGKLHEFSEKKGVWLGTKLLAECIFLKLVYRFKESDPY